MLVPACKKGIGNLKLKEKAIVSKFRKPVDGGYYIFQGISTFQTDSAVFKTGSMRCLLEKQKWIFVFYSRCNDCIGSWYYHDLPAGSAGTAQSSADDISSCENSD